MSCSASAICNISNHQQGLHLSCIMHLTCATMYTRYIKYNSASVYCSVHVAVCRCELRCSNTKACGRHQCRRRCCEGDCPPCDLPCGRRLPCGNHKCPAPCHSGPCLPCPLSSTVACACGQTKYSLPCGSESKAAPPQCRHMCPIPPTCRHAALRPPHRYTLCSITGCTKQWFATLTHTISTGSYLYDQYVVIFI